MEATKEIDLNAERDESEKRRLPIRVFGFRTSALLEMLIFLGVVTTLNFVFGDGARFIEFSPHPFWIIIILIASQYGTNEALLAAGLSSLILLAWNLPVQALEETTFEYVFRVSFKPLLWVITSVVVGELRVRHIQHMDEAQRKLLATSEREQTIAKAYEQLRTVKESLETRIAGHLKGTTALYQSLKSIEALSPVQILMGVGEIVENIINPRKFSVFSFGPNGFEAIDAVGWEDDDRFARRISSDSRLYQVLLNNRRVVCAINQLDAEILENEGIMAGPLVDPDTRTVFGMIKIEHLDFVDLTVTNVETFRILCEWAGSAYSQAQQYRLTLSDAMHNLETGAMSRNFVEFAKELMVMLEKEESITSSVIEISLNTSGRPSASERENIARQFRQAIRERLPGNALFCDGRRLNSQFEVYIPGTNEAKAAEIVDGLEEWRSSNQRFLPDTEILIRLGDNE